MTYLEQFRQDPENDRLFLAEKVILDFSETVLGLLKAKKKTKNGWQRRLAFLRKN